MMNCVGAGGMWWSWLFGALLLIGVIVLVVVLVQVLSGRSGSGRGAAGPAGPVSPAGPGGHLGVAGPPGNPGTQRAKEILAERYARGELNTEEYHERLRTLNGHGP